MGVNMPLLVFEPAIVVFSETFSGSGSLIIEKKLFTRLQRTVPVNSTMKNRHSFSLNPFAQKFNPCGLRLCNTFTLQADDWVL